MTSEISRVPDGARPADLLPIIPAERAGETFKTLLDLKVCGSLPVVIGLAFVVVIIVVIRPPSPELWPLVAPGLLPLVMTARRSTLRFVRTRRV